MKKSDLLPILAAAFLWSHPVHTQTTPDAYATARKSMVEAIEDQVLETSEYLGKSELDPRVIDAIGRVPRHEFVPESLRAVAYVNRPLPIGHDQTISQPYIVAIMTDMLNLPDKCTVLDIGTGSGYQAAVLAEICDTVYGIEIVEALARDASERLARLGYDNVEVRAGDGYYGWPEHAPFDAIVVAAAADELPPPLVVQLKIGGRMIIPVKQSYLGEDLTLVERISEDEITMREILPVLFVPLTGDHD